jgi:hypothetical protein
MVDSLLAGKAAFDLSPIAGVLLQVDLVMTFSSPIDSIETWGSSEADRAVLALVGAHGISRVVVSQCIVSLSLEWSGTVTGILGTMGMSFVG